MHASVVLSRCCCPSCVPTHTPTNFVWLRAWMACCQTSMGGTSHPTLHTAAADSYATPHQQHLAQRLDAQCGLFLKKLG